MASQTTSLQHHFLIAMPTLNDSYFHQAVVFVCDHTEAGAMGLVINQPSELTLNDVFAHLNIPYQHDRTYNPPVYIGGPVAENQGLLLHTEHYANADSVPVGQNLFLSSSLDTLSRFAHHTPDDDVLISLGYAGWDAGQLESEIAQNDWLTVPANHELLFHTSRQDCWQQAAQLLGVNIQLMTDTVGHA